METVVEIELQCSDGITLQNKFKIINFTYYVDIHEVLRKLASVFVKIGSNLIICRHHAFDF